MPARKTHTEFVESIRGRGISVLGVYKNSRTKMWFRCDECNHKWKTSPNSISQGSGCPYCADDKKGPRGHRKFNKIIRQIGEVLHVDVSTQSHPNSIMKINKWDWYDISNCGKYGRFHAVKSGRTLYVSANHIGSNKSTQIHRIIRPDIDLIDHIDMDGLNNLRSNLRKCTRSQNGANALPKKNNTSGYTGVWRDKRRDRWCAEIKVNYKKISIGSYSDKNDAIKARREAEKKYFGDFA